MALKPEMSVGVGLGTAAVVYGIYQLTAPNIADVRASAPNDNIIDGSRKTATWLSAAVVGGISLVTKDATVFIFGGAMVVILDWLYRHGNLVNPMTGKATGNGSGMGVSPVASSGDVMGSY